MSGWLFARSTPLILQSEAPECGIACLAMVASYHGLRTDLSAMRMRLSPSMKGVTLRNLSQIATTLDLSARGVQVPLESLGKLRLPAVLHWDMDHFVVLTKVSGQRVTVHDPARGRRVMPLSEASKHFTGIAMEFTPAAGFRKRDEREKVSAWRLLSISGQLKHAIAQVLLLSLVLEVFAIASPFFLQLVVDRVVISQDRDLLTILGVGFGALVLMQVAVSGVRAWLGVYLSTHMNLRLLDTLFGQLLRLPLAWFEKRHIGDIVSRFRSVDAIQRTLTTAFLETMIDGLMVVLTLGVMFWYSGLLTGIVIGAALLYAALRWTFYGPLRRATDEQLVHEAKASTHFIETLRGMMAIKLNLRENERRSAYQNLVVDQTNAGVRVQNLAIIQRSSNALVFGLENVAVIWVGGLLVLDGDFSVGMLFGFVGFKQLFLGRINSLIDKGIEFRMLDLHAERVADIALAKPEAATAPVLDPLTDGAFEIKATQLGFAYGVEGFAFRGVDFSVRSGETVAIVGPSGSGKTTLVKTLIGLLERTEGELLINGKPLGEWNMGQYRSMLGVVMQDDQLFVGTVEDNISFFDPQHDAEHVRQCARLAMIDAEIGAMPMQYNSIVGSLGMALSGGQKQRILLARALYRRPRMVFLDEAFDQLDLDREQQITEGLRTLGIGLVIVSHRPDTVRTVDRMVRLGMSP